MLLLLLLLPSTACAADAPLLDSPIALSKNNSVRLLAGKTLLIEAAGSDESVAATLVSAEPQEAAGLLMDFQQHPRIFPKLKDIKITPLGESRYRIGSVVKTGPFTFRFTTLWTYKPAQWTATFDLDPEETSDFEEYKGYWKFVPQKDEKTLILYSIKTKTKDNPLSFLEDMQSHKEMLVTLGEFKKALK